MCNLSILIDRKPITLFITILLLFFHRSLFAWDWLAGGDHERANWAINASSQVAGFHYNINDFILTQGNTLNIKSFDGINYGSVTIHAESIEILGMITGDGCGFKGGAGGVLQSTAAFGGHEGQRGNLSGSGGYAGAPGVSSATVSGSGAGGGGGGSYGGAGAAGGSGGDNAMDLNGGDGGNAGSSKGALDGCYIVMGSGGAGAGGGGAGSPENTPGTAGEAGGAGGGCIILTAEYITIKGTITVCGAVGGKGGNGGGPATNSGGGGGGSGGGSGGGVLLRGSEAVVVSTSAVIRANGGDGGDGGNAYSGGGDSGNVGGSGGGGRIKIFYGSLNEYGTIEEKGGSYLGSVGSAGTDYRECLVLPVVQWVYPLNDAYGVRVDSAVSVLFNQQLYEVLTEGAISLYPVRDNSWNLLSTGPVAGTAAYTTAGDVHKLVYTPATDLAYNYLYEIRLSTAVKGILNNNLLEAMAWRFRTRMDCSGENSVVTGEGDARAVVTAGALQAGSYITISAAAEAGLASADSKIAADENLQRIGIAREFLAFDAGGSSIVSNFSQEMTLVFAYADSNGFVDGTDPVIDERYLAVYWLNEDNDIWVKVDGSIVNTVSNTVAAQVAHFTVFSIVGTLSSDVSAAYAFPVPYCPGDGNSDTGTSAGGITFTNLSSVCSINIYTVTGETVKTIEVVPADMNMKNWDVKNEDGLAVFSGVYIYHILSAEENRRGKIIVIR